MLRPQSQHFSEKPEQDRYVIESSDVIDDLRVFVRKEGSERVYWYKERFLMEDEIVENVVENATSKVCWTIHRPKRGWYIRIRAPSFPPGVSIPLTVVPTSSPFHADAALSFSSRTNPVERGPQSVSTTVLPTKATSPSSSSNKSSMETIKQSPEPARHSYPPTPSPGATSASIQPPSPATVSAKLDQLSSAQNHEASGSSEVTAFLLAPHSSPNVPQPEDSSLFYKALSLLKNNKPSHSLSFTLCPLPSPTSNDLSSSITASTSSSREQSIDHSHSKRHSLARLGDLISHRPPPLITFHDRTPAWKFGSTTGIFEIDAVLERALGVDRSFWVSVALAYMEFLVERESYLAAAGG